MKLAIIIFNNAKDSKDSKDWMRTQKYLLHNFGIGALLEFGIPEKNNDYSIANFVKAM